MLERAYQTMTVEQYANHKQNDDGDRLGERRIYLQLRIVLKNCDQNHARRATEAAWGDFFRSSSLVLFRLSWIKTAVNLLGVVGHISELACPRRFRRRYRASRLCGFRANATVLSLLLLGLIPMLYYRNRIASDYYREPLEHAG